MVARLRPAALRGSAAGVHLRRQRGSNGSRNRAWKYYLQRFSDETGLNVVVGHYPPGTSKWNKIEHRMFSFISMNWKGEPLVSFETVVNLISATTTRRGLRVKAVLDKRWYETGVKISDEQMKDLNIRPHNPKPRVELFDLSSRQLKELNGKLYFAAIPEARDSDEKVL